MKRAISTLLAITILLCMVASAEETTTDGTDITCPDGARLVGKAGVESWCETEVDGANVKHGPYVVWYDSGTRKMQVAFVHGRMQGVRTTWYPNGQKSGEVSMMEGVEEGLAIGYHDNGKKRAESQVANGRPCGTVFWWDYDGHPTSCRKDFVVMFGCTLTSTGAECPACNPEE